MPDPEPVLIRLTGVELHTNHGVSDAEQELGQRMLFDLELAVTGVGALTSDAIGETIDYGEVTTALAEVATGQRFRTLERLVSRIADVMLERFPVDSIRVRATKPEPPVPFTMEGASVEIFRRRDA